MIFPSNYSVICLISCFFIWIISEIPVYKQQLEGSNKVDKGSFYIITVGVILGIGSSIVLLVMNSKGILIGYVGQNLNWITYVGSLISILGIFYRKHAQRVLGMFFTSEVRIYKGHQLIQEGPYKIFRHPSYFGSTITFLGFGLMLNNILSAIILFVIALIIYQYRTKVEENALISFFGKEYISYKEKTWGFIPFVK
jgi:protein-S-isoprenylcysteine O-methyltransferase Ste14